MGRYIVRNTFMDRTKTHLHRKAPGLQQEPVVAGRKLKLRSYMIIGEVQYNASKAVIAKLEAQGVIEVEAVVEKVEDATPPTPITIPELETGLPSTDTQREAGSAVFSMSPEELGQAAVDAVEAKSDVETETAPPEVKKKKRGRKRKNTEG